MQEQRSPMRDQDKLLRHPLSLSLLALLFALAMTSALNQRDCSFVSVATGMLPSAEPFGIVPDVRGFLHCAAACLRSLGLDCLSLSYSKEQRECRMYSVFDPRDVTVVSPGYKHYRGCPALRAIRDPCGGDGDCTVDNAECRDSTCQCVIGYHFYPGPGTCVETCPVGYSNTFYVVKGWSLDGFNDVSWENMGLQDCLNNCAADPLCSSIDHTPWWCHLSRKNIPELPHSAWKVSPTSDYYQRDCA